MNYSVVDDYMDYIFYISDCSVAKFVIVFYMRYVFTWFKNA